jgi:hypothetical protein
MFAGSILFSGVYDRTLINSLKYFKVSQLEKANQLYGKEGVEAIEILSIKYKEKAMKKLESIKAKYGNDGIKVLSKYKDENLLNKNAIEMITKYDDKGYYLVKTYPNSLNYYEKYNDRFFSIADKYGNSRIVRYMDESSKYNKDMEVLSLIEKHESKAIKFLENNWGKLTTIGFVSLNSEELILAGENVAKESVKTIGETATKSVENISNSNLGFLIGIGFILMIIFKFGWDKIISLKMNKN